LDGDIVIKIGNDPVMSLQNFYQLLDKYEGRIVAFSIIRDEKPIEKEIEILHKAF
jgi:hypothetical protein